MISIARLLAVCALALAAAGCAISPVAPYARPAPESARAPQIDTAFTEIEASIARAQGDQASGFTLLDRNDDGLRWRLALIDSARHTIDVQYYVWFGDASGRLLAKRLLDAADRGVRVRMLIDDLNTLLETAESVKLRDDVVAWLDSHPNLELRLFNPWRDRSLVGRAEEFVAEFERINHRMHNKAMVVDNRATILGGRNIGDEYLGLNAEFNFHDLDVLGIGPVARQASAVFDRFWNSRWVMPVAALQRKPGAGIAGHSAAREQLAAGLHALPALSRFDVSPRSWTSEIAALAPRLRVGTSRVETDSPEPDGIRQDMVQRIYELAGTARTEVLIVNAYIIPSERTIEMARGLSARGVRITVLTNSLASHDVPAVNSHYKAWRKPILQAGAELYEIRHDAAIQADIADTAPTRARFMGLHSKAMVIDRQRVFIGSMNFDPRSAHINSEMGVVVDSAGLAADLAARIERDVSPANSWRVTLDTSGRLSWTHDRETVTRQPARNLWQRVQDLLFVVFPSSLY
jgi:putative cardiolipin synthase